MYKVRVGCTASHTSSFCPLLSICEVFKHQSAYRNQFILQHIDTALAEIEKIKPDAKPTLVMGYGDNAWKELTNRFDGTTLIYDPETAYKIALPVVEEVLSKGFPQK